jgi:hypothetical protein
MTPFNYRPMIGRKLMWVNEEYVAWLTLIQIFSVLDLSECAHQFLQSFLLYIFISSVDNMWSGLHQLSNTLKLE